MRCLTFSFLICMHLRILSLLFLTPMLNFRGGDHCWVHHRSVDFAFHSTYFFNSFNLVEFYCQCTYQIHQSQAWPIKFCSGIISLDAD